MRVKTATDHGSFGMKEDLLARIRAAEHEIMDLGAHSLNSDEVLSALRCPAVAIAQAGTFGRERYLGHADRVISMKTFGASIPLKELQNNSALSLTESL